MQREKIKKLSLLLEKEFEKSKDSFEKMQLSAIEIAKSSYNSPSQSGDRFHSQGQADIAKENLKNLEGVLKELNNELLLSEIPQAIRPSCWIELEFDGGKKESYFYLKNPLVVKGYSIISSKSPFGSILLDKKVGDRFEYNSSQKLSGKIILIE